MYKRDFNSFIVTLLYLYYQNYIFMKEMEIMQNGEDSDSLLTTMHSARVGQLGLVGLDFD
jgi:hypothetical protein